jgi:hypothetical protein
MTVAKQVANPDNTRIQNTLVNPEKSPQELVRIFESKY